jgi:coenzyme PQQ synthesis protein D (PqqD)
MSLPSASNKTNRYIARSRRIAARKIGDETVIMSAAESTLFTLNPVATAIWEAADGQTPLHQIIDEHVCSAFDVTPEQALADAEDFVARLAPHKVLFVAEQPIDVAHLEAAP